MRSMLVSFWKRHWIATLPAATVALLMGGLWLWARFLYAAAPDADLRTLRQGAFVGWLGLLLLATTVASIIWTAAAKPTSPFEGERRHVTLGYALLGDTAGLLILAVGLSDGFLGLAEVGKVYLLLISWTGLWTAVAYALKRWGPGVSVGVSLTLATLLMAGPVTFVPLARAASWQETQTVQASDGVPVMRARPAASNSALQERIVQGIGIACPLLATLDATRPQLEVHWAQLPGMYAMSGLGQNIPMTLPKWWVNTLVYAGVAALVCLGLWVFQSDRSGGR
jgi:hypothetical protein